MNRRVHIQMLWIALLTISLGSCEKQSNYRFLGIDDEVVSDSTGLIGDSISIAKYPTDGSLAFHENFQGWKRDGYINEVKQDCETDLMTTTVIMYRPDKPVTRVYNNKFPVTYSLEDFAVNPTCGNKAGTSTDTSEVSLGYVALQSEIYYECGGHNSDAQLNLSLLPSVSKIKFSVSYGGDVEYVGGLSLWMKAEGETGLPRVGDYSPTDPTVGQTFTVDINKKNVYLKFVPAISSKGIGVNDPTHSNRNVRIHDLWIWSIKESN
jgi:hypothetical protein